jgi:hypothetical protein
MAAETMRNCSREIVVVQDAHTFCGAQGRVLRSCTLPAAAMCCLGQTVVNVDVAYGCCITLVARLLYRHVCCTRVTPGRWPSSLLDQLPIHSHGKRLPLAVAPASDPGNTDAAEARTCGGDHPAGAVGGLPAYRLTAGRLHHRHRQRGGTGGAGWRAALVPVPSPRA